MNNDKLYDVTRSPSGRPIYHWTRHVPFDEAAQEQLRQVADLPFVFKHVAVMPDVHAGLGATIGSVVATRDAIIPAAVGVDIGCGMRAARLALKAEHLPDNLRDVRSSMEQAIPHGRSHGGGPGDVGAWNGEPPPAVRAAWTQLLATNPDIVTVIQSYMRLAKANMFNHLGTLGTGNHFVELCVDNSDDVWIMVHSGSRGFGAAVGNTFGNVAKNKMDQWFIKLSDRNLAYLPASDAAFKQYWTAMQFCQEFAYVSRALMVQAAINALAKHVPQGVPATTKMVDCHHNFCAIEHHYGSNVYVTRKGAVRARAGDLGIIPGSMGAKSYIVEGLGNRESFTSCSHGAGRAMSRTEARATFTLEDHAAATAGVECRKDDAVLDETPAAYKDIDSVMASQSDLVRVQHTLKQVLCIKG